jgi:hypothetical protein
VSEDPLGLEPDSNPDRYVGNEPTNGVDPTGLDVIFLYEDDVFPWGHNAVLIGKEGKGWTYFSFNREGITRLGPFKTIAEAAKNETVKEYDHYIWHYAKPSNDQRAIKEAESWTKVEWTHKSNCGDMAVDTMNAARVKPIFTKVKKLAPRIRGGKVQVVRSTHPKETYLANRCLPLKKKTVRRRLPGTMIGYGKWPPPED